MTTDELVERLLDWPYQGETMAHEAADRIEVLTAELADAEALIEAQAKDHASNNIRFAEAEHRAKTAEAERDRLREALAMIDAIDPEHRIDGCAQTVVRGLVLRMGETARAALNGDTRD